MNDESISAEPLAREALSPAASGTERAIEAALRPKNLGEFVGQRVVRDQLSLVLEAARARNMPPDHVLLSGPPGLGKTTLAMIIAAELGVSMRVTSGPAIQHAGDLAAVLTSLEEGEVLFVDEIHRLARPVEEMLYVAMEDFRVDVVVGKGPGANAIPLTLPPFTVVGATTRAGLLPAPLRDRFGFTGQLDYYSAEELERVIARSAALLALVVTAEAGREVASRSRGTPRIANRLLRRVRDWAEVRGTGVADIEAALAALDVYQVDERGLDRLDRAILEVLVRRFVGQPVGLTTLAAAVGEEPDTIETVVEPFLLREGLIARTPRGRLATPAAYTHLGQPIGGAPDLSPEISLLRPDLSWGGLDSPRT
ncbi:MAG: Holliday junction branch migration DNA helicase RuvB [Bifidobacteriaceae bacterium]|jgi:Holliday junction DNA helicase RuvB|nr:Holliday junction branch migration DNA helicase RuvB [Bifidobacteriaceae bacterium]